VPFGALFHHQSGRYRRNHGFFRVSVPLQVKPDKYRLVKQLVGPAEGILGLWHLKWVHVSQQSDSRGESLKTRHGAQNQRAEWLQVEGAKKTQRHWQKKKVGEDEILTQLLKHHPLVPTKAGPCDNPLTLQNPSWFCLI